MKTPTEPTLISIQILLKNNSWTRDIIRAECEYQELDDVDAVFLDIIDAERFLSNCKQFLIQASNKTN